jgi:hypothetical protein
LIEKDPNFIAERTNTNMGFVNVFKGLDKLCMKGRVRSANL